MADKGHTELPWKWHAKSVDQAHNGAIYSERRPGHAYAVAMQPNYVSDLQWKADANLIIAAVNTYPAVEGLVKALEGARQFITNGIELGYIRMPDSDTPDPAHQRLPQIEAALSRFRSLQKGGES